MKKIKMFCIAAIIIIIPALCVAATVTSISNLTINPSSPAGGGSVQVSWTYTMSDGYNDPHAFILVSTQPTIQGAGTSGQYVMIGDGCSIPGDPSSAQVTGGGCDLGTHNGPNGVQTYSAGPYTFNLPAATIDGGTFYIIVGMRDYNTYLNPNPQVDTSASIAFTVPLPPPSASITKTAEASMVMPGDTVLFSMNYSYVNATNFSITDNVPAECTFVQASQGGSLSGSTVTWNTSSVPGPTKTGVAWYTAVVNAGTPFGTVINNTANWTMTEVPGGGSSNVASVTVGQPFTITKAEGVTSAAIGDTVTYTFNIQNSGGMAFCGYDNFDSDITGYHDRGNGSWSWQSDGAGGGFIYSPNQTTSLNGYPHYLRNTPTNFCFGTIQVDMKIINTNGASGKDDGLIVFRDDNTPVGGCAYGIGISKDGPDGSGAHSLWLQRYCGGVTGAIAYGVPAPTINSGTWYTLKVQVTDPGNGVKVEAKVWPRGSTEPASWQLTWTDTISGWPACGYVGVQGHPENANNYDNIKIVKSTMSYPTLVDTLPTELTYAGGTAADLTHSGPVNNGQVVSWKIFTTFPQNIYSLQLWSVVNYCGTLLNKASLNTVESVPVDSNTVSLDVPVCPQTYTFTPTYTDSPTATYTATPTPSPTSTSTYTPTYTATPTRTATPTPIVPVLVLTKTVNNAIATTAGIGDTVSYNIHITSANLAAPATSLSIWDTLPNKHTFVAGGPPGVFVSYDPISSVITWSLASLASSNPGTGGTDIWFTATLNSDLNNGDSYFNTGFGNCAGSNGTFASNMVSVAANVPSLNLTNVGNFPNPFDGVTTIKFDLTVQAQCTLKVFTISGEKIKTMPWAEFKSKLVAQPDTKAGTNHVMWDGTNDAGKRVSSGVYFYRIEATRGKETKYIISRMAVVR